MTSISKNASTIAYSLFQLLRNGGFSGSNVVCLLLGLNKNVNYINRYSYGIHFF